MCPGYGKNLTRLGYTMNGFISIEGKTQLSMMITVTKQVIHLLVRKAIFIVRDEGIELRICTGGNKAYQPLQPHPTQIVE